jgi:integrase
MAGIEVRHGRSCRTRAGGRCNCTPTYRASVWSKRDGRLIRSRPFHDRDAAEAWHEEARVALRRGALRRPTAAPTLRAVADTWLQGATAGTVRNRSGDRYKPSTLRGYARGLNLRVLPALGDERLSEIRRSDVQDLVDAMLADDAGPSTIRNTLDPLRAIFRRAVGRELVAINPTERLELPANRGRRDRIAAPTEARELLAALPAEDRALWATAIYAGLRRGELRGLRWGDVDLKAEIVRVERSWDDEEGEIDGKTRAARRSVPIPKALRVELAAHDLRRGRPADDALAFGSAAAVPFEPSTVRRRALAAWKAAGLAPIGLHECRHTFASLMIAAGVNAKALSSYMGHASVTITYDRYGHLMPGNEGEAAQLLDAYLTRSLAVDA